MMMINYTTDELKEAYIALYNTACDDLWRDINIELAKRLDKTDYQKFVEYARIKVRLLIE